MAIITVRRLSATAAAMCGLTKNEAMSHRFAVLAASHQAGIG